ncbi:hemagglutinin repeat-containing protein [Ramlibacter aquaticus]|uniref:Hemagglutinin repeat-containing protein n=2 Tax=Ramlibacter TaxID=174951 RepID=A0ABR9SBF5_9BURK|nr:hemagglutinin repeat-containing protein [Ramlibacter aquaticus]MBE7939122.1 hemagglutinin repeat-containing protein [Ramlibacter aquaticus]
MNQQRHRVVFNRHRGQMMAVSETATASSSATARRDRRSRMHAATRPQGGLVRPWMTFAVLGWLLQPALAQVVANPNAPGGQRPTVLAGANRTPVVNIQTPGAAGVSRNSYAQFDVLGNGVVLNNSRTGAQTQLAGAVGPNPWLATGSARVIVNEVSSSNPTQLNGYVEVGGQKADVVIANPAGIAINGGFINAAGVTLTTGAPRYGASGAIENFNVQGGQLSVNDRGMDAYDADYAHLLARSVQVNAGVWAKDLTVVTGVNVVSADAATVAPSGAGQAGPKPTFAIDVAQLGGVYAGRIWLLATESGVGSTNAGMVGAASSDLVLSVNGELSNLGVVQARRNLEMTVHGDLTNSGTVVAGRDAFIAGSAAISNSGTLAAQGNNTITAERLSSTSAGLLAAGLSAEGGLAPTGDLVVRANLGVLANGLNIAGGLVQLTGGSIDVSGSQTAGAYVRLNATEANGGRIDTRHATVQARQDLEVNAAADVINSGSLYAGGNTTVHAGAALFNTGFVAANGDTTVTARRIAASSGSLLGAGLKPDGGWSSVGDLTVTAAQTLSANGTSVAAGDLSFAGATVDLSAGQILGRTVMLAARSGPISTAGAQVLGLGDTGAIHVVANAMAGQTLNNSAGTLSAGRVLLEVATLNNAAGAVSGHEVDLSLGEMDNRSGTVVAQRLTGTIAGVLSNGHGQLYGLNSLSLSAGTLENGNGQVSSGADVTLNASVISNREGSVYAGRDGTVAATRLDNTGGAIMAGRDLSILAPQWAGAANGSGYGSLVAARDLRVETTGDQNISTPAFAANRNLFFTTSGSVSNSGLLQAQGDLSIAAASATNTGGLLAGAKLSVSARDPAGSITNSGDVIGGTVVLAAPGAIVNTGPKAVIGAFDPNGSLVMLSGSIVNADDTTVTDTAATTTILGMGRVVLAGPADTSGNLTQAKEIVNRSGLLQSGSDMVLAAKSVINTRRRLTMSSTFDEPVSSQVLGDLNISLSGTTGQTNTPDATGIGGVYIDPPHGGLYNSDYLYTTYTGSALQNTVQTISPMARIAAGGNLAVMAGTLQNYWSQVASGGSVDLSGVNVDQESWRGAPSPRIQVSYSGDYVYRTYRGWIWTQTFCNSGCDAPGDNRSYNRNLYESSLTANSAVLGTGATIHNGAASTGISAPSAPTVNVVPPVLPDNGLYKPTQDARAHYLIQTNPRFAGGQPSLSSDYLVAALGLDADALQKRIGDGSYEQRLVNEQIHQLTGRQFVGDYSSVDEEYLALMHSAVTVARELDLRPGVALTAEQVRSLTSDIVWLVAQTVTLPDGTTTTALVPQVYLSRLSQASLRRDGALIAANTIHLNDLQGLSNGGSIEARTDLTLTSQADLSTTGGSLTAGRQMILYAGRDINLESASVRARSLFMEAGNNLNLLTMTRTGASSSGTKTTMDRQAGIEVTDAASIKTGADLNQQGAKLSVGGDLAIEAGGNWNLGTVQTREAKSSNRYGGSGTSDFTQNTGSTVSVGGNAAVIVAGDLNVAGSSVQLGNQDNNRALVAVGGSVNLAAAKDVALMNSSWDTAGTVASQGKTSRHEETLRGASLSAGGALGVFADKDVRLTASEISASGSTTVAAGGSILVGAGHEHSLSSYDEQFSRSGIVSSRSGVERRASEHLDAVGSTIGGSTVNLHANKDVTLQGSNVVSDRGTTISAGGDVSILAVNSQTSESGYRQVHESGLMSNGGLSVTVGTRDQSQAQQSQSTTSTASTVGAIQGNVSITAGQQYLQVGSDILSARGNVDIQARQVQILEARERQSQTSETHFSQSGVTVGLTAPAITALQSASNVAKAVGQTHDGRMKALGSAVAASHLSSAVIDTQKARDAGDKTGGIGISISVGSSHSSSQSSSQSDTARASTVAAGGDVRIEATGGGRDSNLLVQGSEITAGADVSLKADNQIQLQASRNTSANSNQSSSSGASLGLGFNLGGPSTAFSVTASANRSSENGAGSDMSYGNAHVQAGRAVSLQSGGDATLKGASISANQVIANVGGKLEIESLQDRSAYRDSGRSSGFAVTVPIGPGTAGASVSAGKVNIDSHYESVVEQSGIRAGDGGFQIKAQGGTGLVGGAITSTQSAIDHGLNRLETPGIVTRDLQNTAEYKADSTQATLGVGSSLGSSSAGIGHASGQASSVTLAAITGIAGNKSARSGDAETGIKPIFDPSTVRRDVEAQANITAAFGQQAAKAIGDYAQAKLNDAAAAEAAGRMYRLRAGQALAQGRTQEAAALQAQADTLQQQAQDLRDAWGDTGSVRIALHGIAGALTAGAAGAAGAATSTVLAPQVAELADQAGLPKELKQALVQGASALAGAGLAGAGGAAAAVNEADNNYLYHFRGRIIARDRVDNDKIINLSGRDLSTLADLNPGVRPDWDPVTQRSVPAVVEDRSALSMTSSTIQDLRNPNDREVIRKESDMGYVNIDGQARVFIQTGMDNSPKDAGVSAQLLSKTLGVNAGYINNGTEGIGGDVGEYLPNFLTKKDVLNEYTYRTLDAQGPTLIITHSAGNEDARKALQVGALYGHSYENLSFFSVGSPVSSSVLEKSVTRAGASYLGQVNDWRDPVTYSRTAGSVVVGTIVAGSSYGAVQGCAAGSFAGPLGCLFMGAAGGFVGAAPGVGAGLLGFFGLQNYHPFKQYVEKAQSKSVMFDWVKNHPAGK